MARKKGPRKAPRGPKAKIRSHGASLLEFLGDTKPPEGLEEVMQRPPNHGKEPPPKELAFAQVHRTIYLPSEKGQRPKIDLARVAESREYFQASFSVPTQDSIHLPGRTAIREKPHVMSAQVNTRIGVSGHRPAWIPGSYYPRSLPGLGKPDLMRRINPRRKVSPLYVFGGDDRLPYRDPSWPWGLVGKVFTSGGWAGSGALIGPRLVATAGHVVPWGSGPWWMRFIPAFYDGSSLHGAGVESYVSDARGYDVDGEVTGYDWAVLRLYNPLGSWLGYFGYNGYSSSWEDRAYWTLLGYPGAVASGQRPSYQNGVSVFDDDSDSNGGLELETKADLTPGNSGGPMFGWWSGDPRLVGVVSGQEEDWSPGFWPWEWADVEKGNVIAGGSGFTNLMAWGRTHWP